jgi:hypothetical protein
MRNCLAAGLLLVATPAFAAIVYAADAGKYVGQTVTVEGVANVHITASGMTFFNIGGSYPNNPFSAVILAGDAGKFGNVSSDSGRTVDVTGTIILYQGKPEIVLTAPSQLRVK